MTHHFHRVAPLAAALVAAGALTLTGAGTASAQQDQRSWAGVVGAEAVAAAKPSRVTLTVARRVPAGAKVALTGTARPAAPRAVVKLQQRRSGHWHTVAIKKTTRGSTFRFKRHFATVSSVRFRVVVPRHDGIRRLVSKARTVRVTSPGYDVSYPQCPAALPAGAFGIVGVDGGRPFDVNPCLAAEIAWAASLDGPAYYVNTANPGPTMSTHWPVGQQSPRVCDPVALDSANCAYDYGWNAAIDSFSRAAAAATSVGAPAVAGATWWLDVETGNTWESLQFGETPTYLANDAAALTGARDALQVQGVRTVGVYSTGHQWQRITGGAALANAPIWYAGVGGPSSAAAHCASTYSFTGGRVVLAQYAKGGFDADHRC